LYVNVTDEDTWNSKAGVGILYPSVTKRSQERERTLMNWPTAYGSMRKTQLNIIILQSFSFSIR
jgi:hypothetical protein